MKNTEHKEYGFVAMPLDLAVATKLFVAGQVGWIDPTSQDAVIVAILPEGRRMVTFKRLLRKKASIYEFDMGGFIQITKIGDGFTGTDFLLDFRPDDYGADQLVSIITDLEDIDQSDYLDPVDFVFTFTLSSLGELENEKYRYEVVVGAITTLLEKVTRFKSVEKNAYELLRKLKQIGPQHLAEQYDDIQDIYHFIRNAKSTIKTIESPDSDEEIIPAKPHILSARDKFDIAFQNTLIGVYEKAIDILKEKEYDTMTIEELTAKMHEAAANNNMRLAARLRDIIKQKSIVASN